MYENELEVAVGVAKSAGEELLRRYQEHHEVAYKEDASPVTEADRDVDALIRQKLEGAFPQDVVDSEESSLVSSSAGGRFWLVDPIDGTDNFLERNGEFCISLALVVRGQPVVGVVYAPVLSKLYFARKGSGARLNGERIHPDNKRSFDRAVRVVSRHIGGDVGNRGFYRNVRLGSSALRVCAVAEGSADVFYYSKTGDGSRLHPWDVAGAAVVLREAGGVLVDLQKRDVSFGAGKFRRGLVATRDDFLRFL